jgi:CubicO group peptidase (beta-lactamase class C family)
MADARLICFAVLLSALAFRASAEEFTNAIHSFLQRRVDVEKKNAGLVIGLVDEHGSRVVSYGKMGNVTGPDVNGDTLFEIGSITKTFTGLLLQDMIERGEMKLDDPVSKYLPKSVKMPSRHGKQITLLHLATHTSGLPLLLNNRDCQRADNPYADCTVEKLNAFLSSYQLPHDPGTKFEYSELGMELLGYVIALKAGTNYESLVVDRICRPLHMDSTRVTLTPELKSRLAPGRDEFGYAMPSLEFQTLVGGSGLHSTANDLLKYLSATLGLTPSRLTPIMEKTHAIQFQAVTKGLKIGLGWFIVYYPQATEFIMHGGATPGHTTFIIFDRTRRRGVVVLSSSSDHENLGWIGQCLLESEWDSDLRPKAAKINSQDYGAYAGEYQLSPDMALGMLALRGVLRNVPNPAAAGIVAGVALGVVMLVFLLSRVPFVRRHWNRHRLRKRARSVRKRWTIRGCKILAGGLGVVLAPLVAAHVVCALAHPVVDIRQERERLFVQATASSLVSNRITLPHITGELLPESGPRFFERLSGVPMTFYRDNRGRVIRLTAPVFGAELSCVKISDQAPDPPQPPVAIKLDAKLCDACAGQYEFAPDDLFPDGVNLNIQRQGDRLIGRASDKNGGWGAFDIHPENETNFFFTLTTVGVRLNFIKNGKGDVTSVVRHVRWLPDCTGKKLKK